MAANTKTTGRELSAPRSSTVIAVPQPVKLTVDKFREAVPLIRAGYFQKARAHHGRQRQRNDG